jgi:hypothetical protein
MPLARLVMGEAGRAQVNIVNTDASGRSLNHAGIDYWESTAVV